MRMVSLASMGNLSLDCVGMGSVSIVSRSALEVVLRDT